MYPSPAVALNAELYRLRAIAEFRRREVRRQTFWAFLDAGLFVLAISGPDAERDARLWDVTIEEYEVSALSSSCL